jgi:hypothetical protein
MIIGVCSDSHGNTARLKAALAVFAEQGVEAVVHCGDIETPEDVEVLAGSPAPAHLVLGNIDRRAEELIEAAGSCGVHCGDGSVELALPGGQHLTATHGHREDLLRELILGGEFPFVCHGHTHRARDEKIGRVRVINPGALNHPKDPHHPTVAVIDTTGGEVRLVAVEQC